jgi:alanyl-tRNA synthetase
VGGFRIVSESSVSAGTRRITAITGTAAREQSLREREALRRIKAELRTQSDDPAAVVEAVAHLVKEKRKAEKDLAAGSKAQGTSVEILLAAAVAIEGAPLAGAKAVVAEVAGGNANQFRELIDQLRRKASPVAVMLASREEGKVTLVAGISRELADRGLSASAWIKSAAEVVGGSGGGKPDMAQAGGKHPEKLPAALDAARQALPALLAAK